MVQGIATRSIEQTVAAKYTTTSTFKEKTMTSLELTYSYMPGIDPQHTSVEECDRSIYSLSINLMQVRQDATESKSAYTCNI